MAAKIDRAFHASAESMETHKKITIGAAKRAIRRRDAKLADIFVEDYRVRRP
jgi:hypothetical protein